MNSKANHAGRTEEQIKKLVLDRARERGVNISVDDLIILKGIDWAVAMLRERSRTRVIWSDFPPGALEGPRQTSTD